MSGTGHVVFSEMKEVVWGKPAAEVVAQAVQKAGAERVFLMVSGTLNRETGEIAAIRAALGNKCAAVFDRMPPHTPRQAVIEATAMARDAKADLIVTVGGGSITDGAKAVQLCLANDVRTAEDMDRIRPLPGSGGAPALPPMNGPAIRQITVPTTLSAGEFSAISGVTDERTRIKELFRHPSIIPATVVLDPALTRHTPEWLFLSTGIRAVDHCVEGICSNEAHPFADAQALRGLSLLVSGLQRVKANPDDVAARSDCQVGSWLSMAPIATGVPMGASHGIGYVLGAVFDIPHGYTSCVMLPSVMKWNKTVNAARQELVAAAMGAPGDDAGDLLDRFIGGLGMPRSLASVKVGRGDYPRIAEQAMGTAWIPRNPRPIPSPAQVMEILEMAA